jgi:nucleotide-binding universal stress UspA family protein
MRMAAPRLLIAYDDSNGSADAVRAAARLFGGAETIVLHVRPESATLDDAAVARAVLPDPVITRAIGEHERALQSRAEERAERGRRLAEAAGLRAAAGVRAALSAWRAIAEEAARSDADVIVCGSRGQGQLARALLGSTSTSLLHHADRPLLIVPPGDAGGDEGPSVLAWDGSDGARAAIAAAARLLPARPAVVFHAWSSPLGRSYADEAVGLVPLAHAQEVVRTVDELFASRGAELAEEGAELARASGLEARALAAEAHDGAWRAIAAAAREEDAAVIVAGSRGRGALTAAVLGSVSAALAHNAELPVLIAR